MPHPTPATGYLPCPEPGEWLILAGGNLHLTKLPRTDRALLSYCPRCLGDGKLEVHFPPLPSQDVAHSGDGYAWQRAVSNTGWRVIALWGDDGYDLGCWPHQILAICRPELASDHTSWGMVTYTEGDTRVEAAPDEDTLIQMIARYAHDVWKTAGNGPRPVPDTFQHLPEEYKRPFRWAVDTGRPDQDNPTT